MKKFATVTRRGVIDEMGRLCHYEGKFVFCDDGERIELVEVEELSFNIRVFMPEGHFVGEYDESQAPEVERLYWTRRAEKIEKRSPPSDVQFET